MPDPYNYTLNVPNPAQAVMQGVQIAQGVSENRALQAKAAGQLAENARKAQFNAAVQKISANPTAAGYASLAAQYPEAGEVLKESYGLLSAEEQKERISQASSVYSALSSGQPEFAQELLTKQAEAYRTAGREKDAKQFDDLAKLVELSPETAQTTAGLFLATNMGADKFVEGFSKLEAERRATAGEAADLTEKEAKAAKAAVDAKYAESQAVIDLQKKGYDIEKIKNDIQISRENSRIAALNSAIAKEGNEIKRQELGVKLAEFQQKRDDAIRTKVADVTAARASVDNLLNDLGKILNTPVSVIDDATGSIGGSAFGQKIEFDQPTVDFIQTVKGIDSQAFLTQIEKLRGTGSITQVEGEKAAKALKNLSLEQSTEQLVANVREVIPVLKAMRSNLTTKYGIPDTVINAPKLEEAQTNPNAGVRPPLSQARSSGAFDRQL